MVELLDDLRHQIWQHYHLPLLELVREQRIPHEKPKHMIIPPDDPPF